MEPAAGPQEAVPPEPVSVSPPRPTSPFGRFLLTSPRPESSGDIEKPRLRANGVAHSGQGTPACVVRLRHRWLPLGEANERSPSPRSSGHPTCIRLPLTNTRYPSSFGSILCPSDRCLTAVFARMWPKLPSATPRSANCSYDELLTRSLQASESRSTTARPA